MCSGRSHEIGRSLPIVFQRNWPRKLPRNSREIGRFFREFAPENPAKFEFFSRDLPEALTFALCERQYLYSVLLIEDVKNQNRNIEFENNYGNKPNLFYTPCRA